MKINFKKKFLIVMIWLAFLGLSFKIKSIILLDNSINFTQKVIAKIPVLSNLVKFSTQ